MKKIVAIFTIALLITANDGNRCLDLETYDIYYLGSNITSAPSTKSNKEIDKTLQTMTDDFNKRLDDITDRLDAITENLFQTTTPASTTPSAAPPLRVPRNCVEALESTHRSGVYEIQISSINGSKLLRVYCNDETYYGGWTVVARRVDGSVDFNRTWSEYQAGFGDLRGEFFIGLDQLHAMTSDAGSKQELLIKLTNINGITSYAKYNEFEIGDEASSYALNVLGSYAGDAGDAFESHLGSKFTTKDNDNDENEDNNCGLTFNGGWWFKNCYSCFLFAPYKDDAETYSIVWLTFIGESVYMKSVEMLIRPVDSINK